MQIHARQPSYTLSRSPLLADNIVATSQPLAAQAGLAMIARGGNAVDAAIAAAITLTLVEPTGNGLGSDAFAIVWDGYGLHGLNASGRSPAGWTADRFAHLDRMPERGWESVTVPGAVSGWVALSERFGRLAFPDLFEPAMHLAEAGFPVSPRIAALWQRGAELFGDLPGFAATFLREGTAPRAGERFAHPDMARTLGLIAQSGGHAFYEGELAEAMAHDAATHGGAMTMDDLAAHRADWCGTIAQSFDAVRLHEIPPNGQGIAALLALGMLRHTPVRDFGPDSPEAIHLQIEAMKLALADAHAYVADPAHMAQVAHEALLQDDYLAARAKLIDIGEANDFGAGAPSSGGTVYLTAADKSGMMVSFIQSNYKGFGSGIAVPGTAIHLQNRGAGFSLDPASPNRVGPRKRPFHTIIPGFVMDANGPLMSFGVMGGPMQAQGHLQMVLRTQLWKQDPQTAVDAPRWRVIDGLQVACEVTMPVETRTRLSELGHRIADKTPDDAFSFGGAQLIHRLPGGGYIAGSDPRKDGAAVGM